MIKVVLDIHNKVTCLFSVTSIFMSAFSFRFPTRILPPAVTADLLAPSSDLTIHPSQTARLHSLFFVDAEATSFPWCPGSTKSGRAGRKAERTTTKTLLLACYFPPMRIKPPFNLLNFCKWIPSICLLPCRCCPNHSFSAAL